MEKRAKRLSLARLWEADSLLHGKEEKNSFMARQLDRDMVEFDNRVIVKKGRLLLLTEGSKKGQKIPMVGTTKNVTFTSVNSAPWENDGSKAGIADLRMLPV